LSPESREFRFLGQVAVRDDLVRELTDLDYQRDMAFIALRHDAGEKREIGVSRFCVARDGESCECALRSVTNGKTRASARYSCAT
jgi:hypothetical protein